MFTLIVWMTVFSDSPYILLQTPCCDCCRHIMEHWDTLPFDHGVIIFDLIPWITHNIHCFSNSPGRHYMIREWGKTQDCICAGQFVRYFFPGWRKNLSIPIFSRTSLFFFHSFLLLSAKTTNTVCLSSSLFNEITEKDHHFSNPGYTLAVVLGITHDMSFRYLLKDYHIIWKEKIQRKMLRNI